LIGVLLIASPALANVIHLPSGEQFSEFYLLGPERMAENYPYGIAVGQNYSVYVGVGNHFGSSAYYVIYVKLGNQTDQLPNKALGTPSPLEPLYEYRFSVKDGMSFENPFNFLVSSASIQGNNSQISTLQINDVSFNVNKPAISNSTSITFTYQLLFELWRYNLESNEFQYDNRFLTLHLILTTSR
jgi:uncharacterized membrane protein